MENTQITPLPFNQVQNIEKEFKLPLFNKVSITHIAKFDKQYNENYRTISLCIIDAKRLNTG